MHEIQNEWMGKSILPCIWIFRILPTRNEQKSIYYPKYELFLKFTVSKFFISNKMQINIRYHRLLDIAYKLILIRSNQG